MTKFSLRSRSILAAAIGAVLVFGAVSQVNAQSAQDRAEERRARQAEGKQKATKPAEEYPQATRKVGDLQRLRPRVRRSDGRADRLRRR